MRYAIAALLAATLVLTTYDPVHVDREGATLVRGADSYSGFVEGDHFVLCDGEILPFAHGDVVLASVVDCWDL